MPLTPHEAARMRAQARQATEYLRQSNVEASIQALTTYGQAVNQAVESMNSLADYLRRLVAQMSSAFELLARSLPRNWSCIEVADGLDLASKGWPIIWIPRDEIVERLIEAPDDDARNQILCTNSDLILDDVEACIAEMTQPGGSSVILAALLEAVAAARQSLWIACQVTTTAALDTLVGAETNIKQSKVHLHAHYDEDELSVVEMRIALILLGLAPAFETFFVEKGDPVPTNYNRHASVHRLSDVQLTQRNALFSLMLTTSLLRELHEYDDTAISVGHMAIQRGRLQDGNPVG